MRTQEMQRFLDNYMSCVLILFMTIGVTVLGLVLTCPIGVPLPLIVYPRGRGYKESNIIGYNMILIRTLSLLVYFTYIFIDIIIYALRNMS
jgi:hypothetical protein